MKIWNEIMELKAKETRTKGCANTLRQDELNTILATMEYFGASERFMAQTTWDLRVARYRLFDWIASCIDGRRDCGDGSNDLPIQVLAYSFRKVEGDVDEFIRDLRETDYECDRSYEMIELEE